MKPSNQGERRRRRAEWPALVLVGAVLLAGCGSAASRENLAGVGAYVRPRSDVSVPVARVSPLNTVGASGKSPTVPTSGAAKAPKVARSTTRGGQSNAKTPSPPVVFDPSANARAGAGAGAGYAAYTTLLGQLNTLSQAVVNDANLTTPQRGDLGATLAASIAQLQALLASTGPNGQFAVPAPRSSFALVAEVIPFEQAADALLTGATRIAPSASILAQRIALAQRRGQPLALAQAAYQDFLTQTTTAPSEATLLITALANLPSDITAAEAQLIPVPSALKAIRAELALARSDYFTVLASTLLPGKN